MADVTKFVEMVLSATDRASAVLEGVAHKAEKLNEKFNEVSNDVTKLVGIAGLLGGAFSFERMIEKTNEHFGAISRITKITGLAAERADAMTEAFDKAGLGAEDTERILSLVSRAGQRMQFATAGMGGAFMAMRTQAMLAGVDIRKGPETAIIELSKQAKAGKLDATRLAMAFHLDPGTALKMMKLLKQGPQAIKSEMSEAIKSGTMLTNENLKQYSLAQQYRREISSSLDRMAIVVGKEVMPVISNLLEQVAKKLPEWVEHAKVFGEWLNKHLSTALGTVVAIGKVMIANAAIQKATGAGMGNWAGRIGKAAFAAGAPAAATAAVAPAVGGLAAKYASGGVNTIAGYMASKAATGAGAAAAGGAAAGAGAFSGIAASIGRIGLGLVRIVGGFGKLTIIGTLISIIIEGIVAIFTNFKGVTDYMGETWNYLAAQIGDMLEPLSGVGKALGTVWDWIVDIFKLALPMAITGLITIVSSLITFVKVAAGFIGEALEHPYDVSQDIAGTWNRILGTVRHTEEASAARRAAEAAARAAALTKRATPDEREKAPLMNFPNARFEINQAFAEGFDPDRVAVAITGGLAALGERKIQSTGFAPLFGVR